jgi:hypothetical protein
MHTTCTRFFVPSRKGASKKSIFSSSVGQAFEVYDGWISGRTPQWGVLLAAISVCIWEVTVITTRRYMPSRPVVLYAFISRLRIQRFHVYF